MLCYKAKAFIFYVDLSNIPLFFRVTVRYAPPRVALINSPTVTVPSINQYPSVAPYAKIRIGGIISAFDSTVGRVAMKHSLSGSLLKKYAPKAPMRVAKVPNRISWGKAPVTVFDMKQPRVTPTTASGINMGRMHNASDNLSWITPLDSPKRWDR